MKHQPETGKGTQRELRVLFLTDDLHHSPEPIHKAIYPRARGICSGTNRCRWEWPFQAISSANSWTVVIAHCLVCYLRQN